MSKEGLKKAGGGLLRQGVGLRNTSHGKMDLPVFIGAEMKSKKRFAAGGDVPEWAQQGDQGAPARDAADDARIKAARDATSLGQGKGKDKQWEFVRQLGHNSPLSDMMVEELRKQDAHASEAQNKRELNRTGVVKYAKGGAVEPKAMVKKEVAFFKKHKAPASMIKHEQAEARGMKRGGTVRCSDGCAVRGLTKGRFV